MNRSRTSFCEQITGSISTEAFTDVIGEPHKNKGIDILYRLEQELESVTVLDCRNGVGDNEFHVKVKADSSVHEEIVTVLKNSKDNEGHRLTVVNTSTDGLLELKIGKVI